MDKIHVAILNSSKEITDMLTEILRDEGFTTSCMYTYEFKYEENAFDQFINTHKPKVILYDIAPPYRSNYILFKRLSRHKISANIPFVLTTTNKDAVESFVGPMKIHELIGKPYDLQEIIDAIHAAYNKSILIAK